MAERVRWAILLVHAYPSFSLVPCSFFCLHRCSNGAPYILLGATGAKLMTQLVYELGKRKERYGLLAICEGGGTANATIIERY